MNKQEILDMIEKARVENTKRFVEGDYKDGFLDGLGLLWIDINYDVDIK